jgi:hypothetical protein
MKNYEEMTLTAHEDGQEFAKQIMDTINRRVQEGNLIMTKEYMVDFVMGIQDHLASFVWNTEYNTDGG